MNKIFTFLVLLCGFLCHAQDRILFSYDNAGNQIIRQLCISGCPTSKKTDEVIKEISALKEEDLQKFFPEDAFSYYPNPVKEELYLRWRPESNNFISSIQVYGLNGQQLTTFSGLGKRNDLNISFQRYPAGVYGLVLTYANGEQKTIKIIKK